MIKCIPLLVLVVIMAGCTSMADRDIESNKRKSVINSCFTVIESNPKDKWERINAYLDARVKGGYVTVEEAEVILECLHRASGSKK